MSSEESAIDYRVVARIAQAMVDGDLHPAWGANQIWATWDHVGRPTREQIEMLQLKDEWEQSVGEQAAALEARMLDLAREFITTAQRHIDDTP